MTTKQAIEEYITYLVTEKGDSLNTMKAYERDLHGFADFVKDKEVSSLDSSDLGDHLFALEKKGLKKASLVRKGTVIKGFYSFLKKLQP